MAKNRPNNEFTDVNKNVYYSHGFVWKNGVGYKVEEALDKFRTEAEKALKKDSWEYLIKQRKDNY